MSFLDGLNYFNAQDNVELINEPWLVADIIINRPLYWCGFEEYCKVLKERTTWEDFSSYIDSAKSAFFLAYAITIPKYSSENIRKNFYNEFPYLIDRTEDAIAAILFDFAQYENKKKRNSHKKYIEKELSKFDSILHKDILKKMQEAKWIKLDY